MRHLLAWALMLSTALLLAAAQLQRWGERAGTWSIDYIRNAAEIDYGLAALGLLLAFGFLFWVSKRPLGFIFCALAAAYGVLAAWYVPRPTVVTMSAGGYARVYFIIVSVVFALGSLLCVLESRRLGHGRQRADLLAMLNTAVFLGLIWFAEGRLAPARGWFLYAALGVLAAGLAVYAERNGPHRNYNAQLFTGVSVALMTFALRRALPEHGFLMTVTVESLVLAWVYSVSRIVLFKVLNLVTLAIAVVLCMQTAKVTDQVLLMGFAAPANWTYGLAVSIAALIGAAYYERVVAAAYARPRRLSGHWFMADTIWDVSPATAGSLHAAGAAFVLLSLAIAEFGDAERLPVVLAAGSLCLTILGVALATPSFEMGAAMLLAAAHASFYFFVYAGREDFFEARMDARSAVMIGGIAIYTLLAGWRWERFVRYLGPREDVGHYVTASLIPFLGVAMLATLIQREAPRSYAPFALHALALALVAAGWAFRHPTWQLVGVGTMAVGAVSWLFGVGEGDPPGFYSAWMDLLVVLSLYLACDGLLGRDGNGKTGAGRSRRAGQLFVVGLGATVGMLTILAKAPDGLAPWYWLGHAGVWIGLASLFRTPRYQWTAAYTWGASVAWVMFYERDFVKTNGSAGFLAAAALLLGVLIVSRLYFRPRGRPGGGIRLADGRG